MFDSDILLGQSVAKIEYDLSYLVDILVRKGVFKKEELEAYAIEQYKKNFNLEGKVEITKYECSQIPKENS